MNAEGFAWADAVVVPQYGPPEVMRVRRIGIPPPSVGEVRIRADLSGINFADAQIRRGVFHVPHRPPLVLGLEAVGIVESCGPGVALDVGAPVVTLLRSGGYGRLAIADGALALPLSAAVTAEAAAAAALVVTTAYFVLAESARLRSGEDVLVVAAAGAIGSVAAKIARALGARRVVGIVGSAEKAVIAEKNGYDRVIVIARDQDWPKTLDEERFDVVMESAGAARRQLAFDRLRPLGRVVAFGNASGSREPQPEPAALRTANTGIVGFSLSSLIRDDLIAACRGFTRAMELLASCTPASVRVINAEQVVDAHRELEAGQQTGKVIIDMASLACGREDK